MDNILKPSVDYFKCFIFVVALFQCTIYAKVNRNVRTDWIFICISWGDFINEHCIVILFLVNSRRCHTCI